MDPELKQVNKIQNKNLLILGSLSFWGMQQSVYQIIRMKVLLLLVIQNTLKLANRKHQHWHVIDMFHVVATRVKHGCVVLVVTNTDCLID